MEVHTKVKTKLYAKKLRARLVELKKEHEKGLDAYKLAIPKWKKSFVAWTLKNATERLDSLLTSASAKKFSERRRYDREHFIPAADFWQGAPLPPVYPDSKQIRDVQRILRQIGVIGQDTITVSTSDVENLFGPTADAEN